MSVQKGNDHRSSSKKSESALIGKQTTKAVVDRKIADMRKRSRLRRLHSYEEAKAKNARNRIHSTYSSFQQSDKSSLKSDIQNNAEKTNLKKSPKTARDQQSARETAKSAGSIRTIDLTGSDDREDFASATPSNGISVSQRVFHTRPTSSSFAIDTRLGKERNPESSNSTAGNSPRIVSEVARHSKSALAEFHNPHSDSTFTRLNQTSSPDTSPHFSDLTSSLFVPFSTSSSSSTSSSDSSSDFGDLSIISVSKVSVSGGKSNAGSPKLSTNRQESIKEISVTNSKDRSAKTNTSKTKMSSIDATVRPIPTQSDVIVSASSSSSSNASNSSNSIIGHDTSNIRGFIASQGSQMAGTDQNIILVSSTQRSETSSASPSSNQGKNESSNGRRKKARKKISAPVKGVKRKQKRSPSAEPKTSKRAKKSKVKSKASSPPLVSTPPPRISDKMLKMPRSLSIHRHRALSEIHVSRILQRHHSTNDIMRKRGSQGLEKKTFSLKEPKTKDPEENNKVLADSQEQHLTSSPMAPPSTPATPQSGTPKRVAFSSDLESSPTPSSPIKGAPEPRSILKHVKDSNSRKSNLSLEIVHRDLSKDESWPDGYVVHNFLGLATFRSKVIAECTLGLSNPSFTKRYEVFATLNEIIKFNSRDSAKSLFTAQQVRILSKAIDSDLENTAKELKNGTNAFRIRTSIQGLKVLTFLMVHYQVKGASTMLKRIACMLTSANLSKGLAAAILLLLKDQQNTILSNAVETVTSAILQMKYFTSATIITEKLMTIKRLINMHPAVMSKVSYQWLSHVLCCILNTEVPSYERIVNACIYVIYEFSKNTESKDSVFQLLSETLNENASSIRASTMSSLDSNTKVVDALTLTLVYMINRGLCAQALDIWTYLTFMMGYRITNQVDLNSWPGLGHWLKVFDEALRSKSDDIKVAALGSWRAVIFNYQNSKSFSSTSLTKDEFDLKRCIFLYPFNMVPEACSQKVLHAYIVLYYRLIRFLRTLTIQPGRKKAVPQEWVLESIFSPFYVVFLKRPDFMATGIKMLVNVLRFRERPTLKSLDSAETCFRKTSIDDWTLSCLPKHLLLSHYNCYYDLINFLLFNELVPIKSKMLVFDTLTGTLEDCTKNAIVPFDAAQGFLKLLENYLHQYRTSTAKGEAQKPEVSYLCSLVLRAKSVFGLRILTGKSVSMNLVTLMGAFIYKWHGCAGIKEFVSCLHGVLQKKVAFMFLGLLLLHEPQINRTLLEGLSSHTVPLSIMLSEFDIWKDVIIGLDLNGKYINVVIDKIIGYEKTSSTAAHYNNLSCFIANFSTVGEGNGLSRDATRLLLSEYATRCSDSTDETFSPVKKLFSAFVSTASADEVGNLAAALPENKCPLHWYTEVISRCATFPDTARGPVEPVRTWLQDSVGYLETRYEDKVASVVDSVRGTPLEGSFGSFLASKERPEPVNVVEVIPIEDEPTAGGSVKEVSATQNGQEGEDQAIPVAAQAKNPADDHNSRVDVNASLDMDTANNETEIAFEARNMEVNSSAGNATADEMGSAPSCAAEAKVQTTAGEEQTDAAPQKIKSTDAAPRKQGTDQAEMQPAQHYYSYAQNSDSNAGNASYGVPNAALEPSQSAYQGPYYGGASDAALALNAALQAASASAQTTAPTSAPTSAQTSAPTPELQPNAVAQLEDVMQRIRNNPDELLAVSMDHREFLEDQLLDLMIRIRALRNQAKSR